MNVRLALLLCALVLVVAGFAVFLVVGPGDPPAVGGARPGGAGSEWPGGTGDVVSAAAPAKAQRAADGSLDGFDPRTERVVSEEKRPKKSALLGGREIKGRVFDAEGEPVKRAHVRLTTKSPRLATEEEVSVKTNRDGAFRLKTPRGELDYLWVVKYWEGTCSVDLLRFDPDVDHDLGDLYLTPLQTLEGRLVCAGGVPLPGVRVEASGEDPIGSLQRGFGYTDELGGFVVPRILPGEYTLSVVDVPGNSDGGTIPLRTNPETKYAAGATGIQLATVGRWLRLNVTTSRGDPLPSARVDGTARREIDGKTVPLWNATAHLGRNATFVTFYVGGFEGGTFVVQASSPGLPAVEKEIELAGGACFFEESLAFPDPEQLGSVRLAIRDSTGRTVTPNTATFYSARSGTPLVGFVNRSVDEDEPLGPLQAGDYRVRIDPGGRFRIENYYLPVELDHTVVAGVETKLTATAETGGRLRVSVHTEGNEVAPFAAYPSHVYHRERRLSFVGGGRLEGREVHGRLFSGGSMILSDVFPAGPLVLRVTSPTSGCEPTELRVTIVPGRLNEAHARLSKQ